MISACLNAFLYLKLIYFYQNFFPTQKFQFVNLNVFQGRVIFDEGCIFVSFDMEEAVIELRIANNQAGAGTSSKTQITFFPQLEAGRKRDVFWG